MGFDLPMALGLVGCQGQFFGKQLDKMMFLGELSLDGSVRSVRCQRLLQRGSSG
jgi:predicted ATPase with chaperone activity